MASHPFPQPPSSSCALPPAAFSVLIAFILLAVLLPADAAPSLSLNGHPVAVLTPDILAAFAAPRIPPSLPLSSLFPPIESLQGLEIRSPSGLIELKKPRLTIEIWQSAEIIISSGSPQLRIDSRTIIEPENIAVEAVLTQLPLIHVWSAVNNASRLERNLKAVFTMRMIPSRWRRVQHPAHLLENPPGEGLPHIILLDDLNLIRSLSRVISYRRLSTTSSRWIVKGAPRPSSGAFPEPAALNARSPEAALAWLMAENPNPFDGGTAPFDRLARLFQFAVNQPERVIVTDAPLRALSSGRALSAFLPAASDAQSAAAEPHPAVQPPRGAVNIIRGLYAAVPAALSENQQSIADILLTDAARLNPSETITDALPLPIDPRTLRFFEAYNRIGRLPLSGQMKPSEAARLIRTYVRSE